MPHPEFATPAEALRARAAIDPDRTAVTFLRDGEEAEESWTNAQLADRSRRIAAKLVGLGATGERALVLHPPGLELVASLFACFKAGVAAVPTYPPSFNLRSRSAARFGLLAEDAGATLALTDEANAAKGAWFSWKESSVSSLRWVATDRPGDDPPALDLPAADPDAPAVIQYTSGSTRTPRGVVLSGRNLMANLDAIDEGFGLRGDDVILSWLPPYHDMGLIGNLLGPIAWGIPLVLMAPHHVAEKPARWLRAIARHGVTVSGGPNFGYDLCARGVADEERRGMDLSRWRIAFSGAERVRPETLRRFAEAFTPCGFRPEAFLPCYGLAESTLYVTGERGRRGASIRSFDRDGLARNRAEPAEGPGATELVSCGRAAEGHRVVVAGPETGVALPEGRVGEVWTAGPSVARGYWGRAEESAAVFGNALPGDDRPYLRTGDLGFIHGGDLYVTGRRKDLLIVRGRNFAPQDIEEVAELSHPALELSGAAAFGVEVDGEERAVLACEVRREARRAIDPAEVIRAIREAVAAEAGLRLHEVILLRPRSLPRTTSGKVRHAACRDAYLGGNWDSIAASRDDEPSPAPDDEPDLQAVRTARRERRPPPLERYVRARLARLLKTSEAFLAPDRPLGHLGVDSLLGFELFARVEADLGIVLPPGALTPETTLARFVDILLDAPDCAGRPRAARPIESAEPGRAVPLTPIQAEFLAPGPEHPGRFATVITLRTPRDCDLARLESALRGVVDAHDAFRLRFHRGPGRWRQVYAEGGSAVAFRRVDARAFSLADAAALHRSLASEGPAACDAARGPLVVADWVDRGPDESGVLQLGLNHLVCDGLSASIVVGDLQAAYERLGRGEPASTRDRATSFGAWATALDALAQSPGLGDELDFWRAMARDLPPAWLDPGAGLTAGGPRPASRFELSPAQQRRFLERFPTARDQHLALLASLAHAWGVVTGQDELYVRLQNHGRRPVEGLDPAGVVGWFVVEHPFRAPASALDDAALIDEVGRRLDAVPRGGLGHGLLSFSRRDPAARDVMAGLPLPRVAMSYYAHLHDPYREDGPLPALHEYSYNASGRPEDGRYGDLWMKSGQDRGTTWWAVTGWPERYAGETLAALAGEVGAFLRRVLAPEPAILR